MQYKSALIDLDDVLFPTYEYTKQVIAESISAMIKKGLDIEYEKAVNLLMAIREERGSNARDHFDCLCYIFGIDPKPIVDAGVEAYHSLRDRLWVPQKDTDDFLNFLNNHGYRASIITRGLEEKQWFKIDKLGIKNYFLEMDSQGNIKKNFIYILPDAADKTKGKEELSSRALSDMQADPEKSFVIDDRPYGIIAAKRAGVKYGIRLRKGKYIEEECPEGTEKSLRHDFEVKSLSEAAEVISDLEKLFESKQAS